MSMFHRCAVGFFEPGSLVLGEYLKVARPLEQAEVQAVVDEFLRPEDLTGARPATEWDAEGYLVVEYIAGRELAHRTRLVHALMAKLGCDVVDVLRGGRVRSAPWRRQ